MSNQFGLILSFVFLALFLSVSTDIFSYQAFNTTFNAQTLQIANHIQKQGYDKNDIDYLLDKYDIDDFKLESKYEDYFYHYSITFKKHYDSKIFINGLLDRIVVRKYEIYKKG